MLKKIFGREVIDQKAIDQLQNCLIEGSIGVLSADAHAGYSMPIGGIVAYRDHISPSGVGYDIACGNKAVMLDVKYDEIKGDLPRIMDEIVANIGFGVGRPGKQKVDHGVIEKIAHSPFEPQRKLWQLAESQLGTIGSGNHFIDIFKDDDDWIWIGVHFGSRGFGHKTASGFMAMDQGETFESGKHKEKDTPVLFDLKSGIGQAYMQAMTIAGDYAYAGRDTVVDISAKIIGANIMHTIHNHHNFAWMEEHFGEVYCVVRKGATPAAPGQHGFIGANMMDNSVIIEGIDSKDSQDGLYSTVHGAGRIMSRTQAAGKQKWVRGEDGKKRPQRVSKGLIDFDSVKTDMAHKNIILRGAGADEAPGCYKKLSEVLDYHAGTIKVVRTLTPLGVAMAGADEFDPYKD